MSLSYRREIDGLRAIAVTSVILYHAGLSLVGGGYIGVDIFFVISGYLITTILLSEAEAGHVSIVRFYERRVRRILPALITVILATLPFAWAWMLPEQLRDYGKSLVAVMVFASNILFWRQSDYFAPAAEEKPMLHTWSLAVEEQFYVFFPLAVALLWRFGAKRFTLLVWATALASLAVSDWASRHAPTANFYLLPTRAWELFAGSLCAIWHFRRPLRGHEGLAALGLAMLVVPIFLYTDETPFPGRYAVVPVAGTALVILFATSGTWTGKLLGLKPMVGIGLVSYSAYLWHQPLFAFARIRTIGDVSPATMGLLILASFALAVLSWRFVEQPFRGRAPLLPRRPELFGSALAASIVVLIVGGLGVLRDGFPARFDSSPMQQSYLDTAAASPFRKDCHTTGPDYRSPKEACHLFGLTPKVVVLGNSHGVELSYALAEALRPLGIGVEQQTISGCPPAFGAPSDPDYCRPWTEEAVASILADPAITHVVVSYSVATWVGGDHPVEEAAITDALGVILDRLASTKRVIYVTQMPTLPGDIHKIITYSDAVYDNRLPGRSRPDWMARRAVFDKVMAPNLARHVVLDTTPLVCDDTTCFAGKDGLSFYFDNHHMSVDGARIVAKALLPLLGFSAAMAQKG